MGCVIEHRCGTPIAVEEGDESKLADEKPRCVAALDCKKKATVEGVEVEWECSASWLVASMASMITIANYF